LLLFDNKTCLVSILFTYDYYKIALIFMSATLVTL